MMNIIVNNNVMTNKEIKDALAKAIIYGASSLTVSALGAAAVAAGLIDRGYCAKLLFQSKRMGGFSQTQNQAWETYKKTGSLEEAFSVFFD